MKKKTLLFLVTAILLVLTGSCKKEENDNEDEKKTFALRETYGGGIIFYLDNTGQHGLIAATGNQVSPANIFWGCQGTIIGGTGTASGTGQSNTTAIVNACPSAGIAARLCDQLILEGFSDWYLPSKDELNLMYENLHEQGLGDFSDFLYWSSSEVDEDNVWVQNFWDESPFFDPGGQYIVMKEGDIFVRAIRTF